MPPSCRCSRKTALPPQTEGNYTVRIFVWDGVTGTPTPLSEVTVKNIAVTE